MHLLVHDLKHAVRMLLKSPAFTAAAVLTLALGIGLNTATFSAVHAILLRPLPGTERPERLVQLYRRFEGDFLYGSNSVPHYVDLRDGLGDVFEDVAAWSLEPVSFSGADGPSERLTSLLVSANFFQTYGAVPTLGRAFVPDEEAIGRGAPGGHPVAVLSHRFWLGRFGGDPGVVGRTVRLNGRPFQVVGVAPEAFKGPIALLAPEVYVPLVMQREIMPGTGDYMENRGTSFMSVTARLRDGVTMDQARQAVDAFYGALRERYPRQYGENGGITFVPQEQVGLHPMLRSAEVGLSAVVMAVVVLLLFLACVNVANLFLARAGDREREMGIRLSLGARRGRILRQLLTESLVFALLAGGSGLVLAWLTVRALNGLPLPVDLPWQPDVRLGTEVLLFTLGISVAAGLLFGLAPALRSSRPDVVRALKSETSRGARGSRTTRALVTAQVGLSLLLLATAGLFLRSLQGATRVDKGFRTGHLLLASVDPVLQGYSEEEAARFLETLVDRIRGMPGVRAAALAEVVPLGTGSQQTGISVPGYEFADNERRAIDYNIVGDGYFQTLGIEVLRGRGFTPADREGSTPVIVVNQRFAERFWPGEDAVGRTVAVGGGRERQVVGVVETGRYRSLGEDPLPYMYLPHGQDFESSVTLHVRTVGDPAGFAPDLRRAVADLDPDLPVSDVRTMENHLGLALLPARLAGVVLGMFGLLGLILAAVGIYGVMAYSVSRRRREIGIRAALGADRGALVGMVLREGMKLAAVGAAVGLVAAGMVSRAVQGLLYGVPMLDPATFLGVPSVLLAVAALAVWLPARRATRVDPSEALRAE